MWGVLRRGFLVLFALILCVVIPVTGGAGAASDMLGLKASDVLFSTRWPRAEAFSVAESFHATHFVWVYLTEGVSVTQGYKFVVEARQKGYEVFAALNSKLPDFPGGDTRLKGRVTDLDGKSVTAPWMVEWRAWWGCVNSPEYRQIYLSHAKMALDAGVVGFQMDDPRLNWAALNYGGCYCQYCMAAFNEYLEANVPLQQRARLGLEDLSNFDFGEYMRNPSNAIMTNWLTRHFEIFQRQAVEDFYREIREEINSYAGRYVHFSSNNYRGEWGFPYDLFDYGMAELPERDAEPRFIYERLQEAANLGKTQIFTLVSQDVALTRRVIATTYAAGGFLIVPWDVYISSSAPRYFGDPKDFADLYGFIRKYAVYFDGYTAHAVAGGEFGQHQLVDVGGADVVAFVRTKNDHPVVIHLVDWSETPEAFVLRLSPELFRQEKQEILVLFPDGREMSLVGTYQAGYIEVEVPPVTPWGIAVIQ